jgi:APA family basic amino acid/polyamine antiporter
VTDDDRDLRRQLGVFSLAALVVGQVIAVGIFLTPAGMARSLGSPLLLLATWLLMGLMAVCGALCYGELAARYPDAGGGYVYLREAFGPGVAFVYGWKCLLVMDPGITAALAMGMASYVGYLTGLSGPELKLVAVGTIAALATVNAVGLRVGARLVESLTVLKLGALAVIVFLPVILGLGDWGNFTPLVERRSGSDPLPEALAAGFVGAFFAFGGWWEVSKLAGEVREPARTVPRALVAGVSTVTVAYVLTSAAFLYLVPIEEVASDQAFAARVGEILFGTAGGGVFAGVVVIAVLGSLAVLLMALPRVYYAMARDDLFFRAVGAVHPRFSTPARAIGVQAVLASLLVAVGTFETVLAYFIFPTVAFIALTVAGVFVIRRREGRAADARTFRIPGYPATPMLFLALAAVLLLLLAAGSPLEAGLGVGVVALGIPAYRLLFREGEHG